MIKAPISGYWAVTANERLDNVDSRYFAWLAAKYVARGISTLFLMGLFLKVDARSLPQKNRDVRINQFLVPATMLVILGAFLESLIDEHVGLLDSRLRFVSKCSHALFFFDFYLFTFLCLSFISFVHFWRGISVGCISIHQLWNYHSSLLSRFLRFHLERNSRSFPENSVTRCTKHGMQRTDQQLHALCDILFSPWRVRFCVTWWVIESEVN